jgi:hypothetical protein
MPHTLHLWRQLKRVCMGLYIQSLENISKRASRDYFIYLLDYGWNEPLGEALMANHEKMVVIAAENREGVLVPKANQSTKFEHFKSITWLVIK